MNHFFAGNAPRRRPAGFSIWTRCGAKYHHERSADKRWPRKSQVVLSNAQIVPGKGNYWFLWEVRTHLFKVSSDAYYKHEENERYGVRHSANFTNRAKMSNPVNRVATAFWFVWSHFFTCVVRFTFQDKNFRHRASLSVTIKPLETRVLSHLMQHRFVRLGTLILTTQASKQTFAYFFFLEEALLGKTLIRRLWRDVSIQMKFPAWSP